MGFELLFEALDALGEVGLVLVHEIGKLTIVNILQVV